MGSCLSKKGASNAPSATAPISKAAAAVAPEKKASVKTETKKAEQDREDTVKKEIFIIKHRRSHDKHPTPLQPPPQQEHQKEEHAQIHKLLPPPHISLGTPIRTSSCTREEVDAILIQCGRLSRSSSANTPAKKYSGSKRSYDFDNEAVVNNEDELEKVEKQSQRRQSRSRSSPSKPGRRRTPSRERDSSQQRSGSRERAVAGSGRRVSRSPGRRSEITTTTSANPIGGGGAESNSNNGGGAKPGKMVSIPASVLVEQGSVRRVAVKRDVRSPRSQSPAQGRPQQQQPLTLNRSNSRKTDQSPYRRNPLSELDNNHSSQRKANQSQNVAKGEAKLVQQKIGSNSQVSDGLQPKLNRSRSWSRSRDFDEMNRGADTGNSYASILLEDIQNFHQKSSSNGNVAFALPQCVTNACSIMEAVADMNSTTSSSIMSNEERKKVESFVSGGLKKQFEPRDSFVETELAMSDDLMEPSLHKYVTMRRGALRGADMADQESSGSNSVAGGGQQRWGSPSEPNSVESGCLTSKASTRKDQLSPLGFQRQEFL